MTSPGRIPAPDVRVRILNVSTRKCIYSNSRDTHQLNHFDGTSVYDDQYWYIKPGQGDKQGLYMIVSAATGRALWANWRNGANNRNGEVGTGVNPGCYDDHYFDLEQTLGTGVQNGQFRIHSPAGKCNFFTRTHAKPELGCLADTGKIWEDQWFTFETEPLEFVRIVYDEDHPEIITAGIKLFPPQKATNHDSIETTQRLAISEETEQQSTFTAELGISITASVEFSCGVPLVSDGKVGISTTVSTSFAWGTTNISRQKWEAEVTLKCAPHSSTQCTASLLETRLRMPFVAHWKTKKSGVAVQTKGMYEGQSCASLSTVTSPLKYVPLA